MKTSQQALFEPEIKEPKPRYWTNGTKRVYAREILKTGPNLKWRICGVIADERDVSWEDIVKDWFGCGPTSKIAQETVDRIIIKFNFKSSWYEALKDAA